MRKCRCGRELKPGQVLCSECQIKEQRRFWEKVKWRQSSSLLDEVLSPLTLKNFGGRK